MALADYKLCDLCDSKVFYDANLNYEQVGGFFSTGSTPFRVFGQDQYHDPEMSAKYGLCLDYLGDWAVICINCSKTHKTQIVKIEEQS
ncbi:hypothetical protein [uncultured Halomonas sp.]|uniref:hypothetical protein n=1 Tax=uncultured Halomonas sp. TaxID=173971 RepID=UPI002602F555|nr:hypothetical protein [uncultured Halomonas sp.]